MHENVYIENKLIVSLFYSIDRIGVPLFFMLSGGLILPKIVNTNIITFYKKRIPQFFILIIVWSIITNFSKGILDGNSIKVSFLNAIPYNGIYPGSYYPAAHMWFMYAIIQLYLIAPFLAKLLDKLSNYNIFLFLFIGILLNQLKVDMIYFLEKLGWGGGETLQRFGSDFVGPYVIYFILGYLIIHRNIFSNIRNLRKYLYYFLLLIIPIMATVYIDFKANNIEGIFHWYSTSIPILVSSVGLIFLIRDYLEKIESFLYSKYITLISICSFGIYLSHYAFIFLCMKLLKVSSLNIENTSILMIVYFIFSFCGGLLLTYLMMKNKLTRYFVA